jgi:uncharacterized protein (TIGR00369 family)
MNSGVPDDIPCGFEPLDFGGPFVQHNGLFYLQRQADSVRLGFYVKPEHVNPMASCHGGMLATFCDTLLLATAHFTSDVHDQYFPTIGLQIDYLAAAPQGAWVQGHGQILRATRSLLFIQGLVESDGQICARTSGTFKIMSKASAAAGAQSTAAMLAMAVPAAT